MIRYRVLIVSLLTTSNAFAQVYHDFSFYTKNKEGDTLISYVPNTPQLLLFTDDLTCWTCTMTVNNILQGQSRENIKCIVFQRGSGQLLDTNLKTYELVIDKVSAYHKLYNVQNSGVAFLLDSGGVIKFIGAPGKSSFDVRKFNEAVSSLSNNNHPAYAGVRRDDTPTSYKHLKKLAEVTVSVSPAYASTYDYLDASNHIAILAKDHTLYVCDTNGQVIYKRKLKGKTSDSSFTFTTPVLAGETIRLGDTLLVLADADNSKLDLHAIGCSWKTDSTFVLAKFNSKLSPVNFIAWNNMFSEAKSGLFTCRCHYLDTLRTDTLKPLMRLDIKSGNVERFGNTDPFYLQSYLISYGTIGFAITSDSNIYTVHALGRNLMQYDAKLNLLQTVELLYDSTMWDYSWLEKAKSYNSKTPVEEFMRIQKQVTMLTDDRLLYDSETGTIGISLLHMTDSREGKLLLNQFLHLVRSNGQQYTTRIPNNGRVIRVFNNQVWALEEYINNYKLVKYQLED